VIVFISDGTAMM